MTPPKKHKGPSNGGDRNIRRLGVLLERVDGNVQTLVEGHQLLDTRIGRHYAEFHQFRKNVDEKFGVVLDELRLIRHELKEKVGREEFLVLEKRVAALEKRTDR